MTDEQRAAFAHLRELVRPFRLRVVADAEGFPVIPGRRGRIEWQDGAWLAVYTDRPRLFATLQAIPGVKRHQAGDAEIRALFPPDALGAVAAARRARKRRPRPTTGQMAGLRPWHRATLTV